MGNISRKPFFYILGLILLIFLESACMSNLPAASTDSWAVLPAIPDKTQTGAPDPQTMPQFPQSLVFPIDRALERITKKTFGLKVSPKDSPVSPERFTWYHAGTDFETFNSEQDTQVKVVAVCTGPLVLKKRATGYGWVAVQRCKVDAVDMTVVYGHLKLESISITVGSEIQAGQQLGILGKGFSAETDGERKHLHLGIHKWATIDIRGYSSTKADLSGWLDPMKLFTQE